MVETKTKAELIIPQNVQDFAREFTELAKRHGLRAADINIRFTFGFTASREWDDDIVIAWSGGRHGEDIRKYHISTTLRIFGEVDR